MIKFKYVSLFSGVGGFEQALNRLGGKCVLASEIDKFAKKAYEALYGSDHLYGDITKVDENSVPDHDVLVGGFPCFVEGTLITTKVGIKPIEDVRKGDEVLTHTNTFKPVVVPMIKRKKGIYDVKIQGSPVNRVTEEHPYYVREMSHIWNNEERKYVRTWSEPRWVDAKDLVPGKHFVGFSENKISENPYNITEEEAWLIGRYLADGYLRINKRSDREDQFNNWVVFCIGKDKLDEFKDNIKDYYVGYSEERTAYKGRVINERLTKLCLEAGRGSENKRVPGYILNLPKHLLVKFLDGYLTGDGSVKDGKYKATSVSKELIYGLGQVVQKLYNTPYSIVYTERPETTVIEGRTVNQRDTWSIEFRKEVRKQNNAVYIDGMLWNPVRSVEYDETFEGNVYNFEVADDNSYVANNATVHNCQAFSVAGKRGGFEDARGTLFFEMARIAAEKQPKVILAENVKGLVGHDKGKTLDTIVKTLNEIGYRVDFQIMNSKYFGVPQNRERIYIVAIREDLVANEEWADVKGNTVIPKGKRRLAGHPDVKTFNFDWPDQEEVTTRLIDVLETKVDERYYLSEEKTEKLVAQLEEKDKEDAPNVVHNIYGGFKEKKPRVFKDVSPTIRTSAGGGHLPSLLESLDAGMKDNATKVREDDLASTIPASYYKGLCGQARPHVLESKVKGCSTRTRSYAGKPEQLEVRKDDVSNTVTSVTKDAMALEVKALTERRTEEAKRIRREYQKKHGKDFSPRRGKEVVPREDDLSNCVTATQTVEQQLLEKPKYRIRKLTPLETFRLQGFPDEVHATLVAAGISNTQLYKMAGNAVTVNVIKAIGERLVPLLDEGKRRT